MRPQTLHVLLVCIVGLTAPRWASAQSETCPPPRRPNERPSAVRARDAYNRGTRETGGDRACWFGVSINVATEMIAAGDDQGLVFRARALLARDGDRSDHVTEAARDLGEYVALHPPGAPDERPADLLPEVQPAGIARLQQAVMERIAWVTVESRLRGVATSVRRMDARVGISAMSEDGRTHYLLPGLLEVFVTATGHAPVTRQVPLAAGRHRLLIDEAAETDNPLHISLRPAPGFSASEGVPVTLSTQRPLRPWILPTVVTAGAFAALGVAFTAWWASERSTYDDQGCRGPVTTECSARYDDIGIARGLLIASYALSGAFTAGAVTLWLLDRRSPAHASSARGCTLLASGGIRCAF